MKPAAFEYVRPDNLQGALAALRDHPDGKVLAGGQSLIPLMNFRLSRPQALVDISHLTELTGISVVDGAVEVGALVRHQQLHEHEEVRRLLPVLSEAAGEVGHWAIRNRGTLGGSLTHADPAAELPAAAVALRATVVLANADGQREVPAESFFLGFLTTDIQPDEILVAVRFPVPPADVRYGFAEFARRPGDFALAGAFVEMGGDASGSITWFGVSGGPERRELDFPDDAQARKAAFAELAAEFDTGEDAVYRRKLAVTVAEQAYQKAREGRR
ncbi:MAG: FAD binding domain-containing protein [Alicyclobacillus sp.]|nr:FAD binding domain-containing protein [Alicyclobacillus sp.]